ncbi:MAG TPA: hypothetical protein VHD56_06995, partial [Tepidisphaeraceae bacterium]|nr:hypothetical protein [Tepidisphaeraceae bacterium]
IAYIVVRDLAVPLPSSPQSNLNVIVQTIRNANDPLFPQLVEVCRAQGVAAGSCKHYLDDGAIACVARLNDQPIAVGWMTFANVFVPLIGSTFAGQNDSCLLFGDFVLPEFRGHRLQRLLGMHRLAQARDEGIRWSYGYIMRGNTPSLSSAIRRGFRTVATVHHLRLARRSFVRVHQYARPPIAPLRLEGWPQRPSFFVSPGREGEP